MRISLQPRLEKYLEKKVSEGGFSDAGAVIIYAIERLRTEDAWFARNADELRREVAIGIGQLDRGEGEEWDAAAIEAEGRLLLRPRKKGQLSSRLRKSK